MFKLLFNRKKFNKIKKKSKKMISYFSINSTLFVQFSNNLIKDQYFYGTVICVPLGIFTFIVINNIKIM
jgi:hypothetical protein